MLRRAILLLALVAACGGDDPTEPPPQVARVRFAIDGATCQGSGTLLMFVDGVLVGSEFLSAGQASGWHEVSVGFHDLGARMQDNSFAWPTTRVPFIAGLEHTHSLKCT